MMCRNVRARIAIKTCTPVRPPQVTQSPDGSQTLQTGLLVRGSNVGDLRLSYAANTACEQMKWLETLLKVGGVPQPHAQPAPANAAGLLC